MMEITTYYVTCKAGIPVADEDAKALVHLINDTGAGNCDNRSWNALHAQIDALLDAETQRRLGIVVEAERSEATDD
jgi:hypothetical protein